MVQVIKADLDEMVFEERERRYGAYFLRKEYPGHLTAGTAIATVAALLISFGPLLMKTLNLIKPAEKARQIAVNLRVEDLPSPPALDEDTPPPPLPPKVEPPQVRTVAFNIPVPAPDEEVKPDETIQRQDSLKVAKNLGTQDIEGDDVLVSFDPSAFGDGEPEEIAVPETEPKDNIFIVVEQEPVPINVDEIRKLIGYPQIAKDAGIEGNVVVRVLVDKRGAYVRHKVISQAHPVLSSAVEAQIGKLKFSPAIQGGKPIQFWVNIPFSFKLQN
ncbi:MAG: TonB family protein [Bacteroidia bacterium]|nr:TonB family protein [Bacteroidia bacterium]